MTRRFHSHGLLGRLRQGMRPIDRSRRCTADEESPRRWGCQQTSTSAGAPRLRHDTLAVRHLELGRGLNPTGAAGWPGTQTA